jgi:putative membrane protein
MVQYNPNTWIGLIFHSYSKHIIKILFPALLVIGIYTAVLVFVTVDMFEIKFQGTTAIHSLLGIVLGLFLVFRTNSAYDRWWEGRKNWGALVNNTRNMALKLGAFLDKDDKESRFYFAQMIPNFVFALKEHLREGVLMEEMDVPGEGFLERLEDVAHKPNIISLMLYERVNDLYMNKKLTQEQFFVLDKELKSFSDIMGACERIKNTPIPYSYSMYIKKFIFTYIITLPFAFIYPYAYWTVPMVLLVFFMLVTIELIAEEIEDPFGRDGNDLPTDELSGKIKNNVREILI